MRHVLLLRGEGVLARDVADDVRKATARRPQRRDR